MSDPDCLFCKICDGEIPADIVMQTDDVVAFRDINPQAPTHILIIPKQHIATVNNLRDEDHAIVGKLFVAARDIARDEGYLGSRLQGNDELQQGGGPNRISHPFTSTGRARLRLAAWLTPLAGSVAASWPVP